MSATSYEEIIDYFSNCTESKTIKVDSLGGTVHPLLLEAHNLMAQYEHKYIISNCCSAAYWLCCSGNLIALNNLSIIGSIGVLTEVDEQNNKTFLRASESTEKNLSPIENSEYVVKHVLDPVNAEFKNKVLEHRSYINTSVFSGKSCLAEEALKLNLINSISENYMSKNKEKKEVQEIKEEVKIESKELESEKTSESIADLMLLLESAKKDLEEVKTCNEELKAKNLELVASQDNKLNKFIKQQENAKKIAAGDDAIYEKIMAMGETAIEQSEKLIEMFSLIKNKTLEASVIPSQIKAQSKQEVKASSALKSMKVKKF